LKVKDKPILEHILNKIERIDSIDEIFIVTNNKFFTHFLNWKETYNSIKKITIVNDRTKSNDDRLGSLGDIKYAVENLKIIDDIIVIAGDNLFEFSLRPIMDIFKTKEKSVVALYDVKDLKLAKLYGIVSIDKSGKIIDFEEKPKNPKSTLSSTGIYLYPKYIVKKLIGFVKGHDADKAGNFLEWLYKQDEVYCYVSDKNWFDIGSIEQFNIAKEKFEG
jgi:glucose-1-phosphate thymidylyltransferase